MAKKHCMQKLKEYIDILCDGKKIRGMNMSPSDVYTLIDIYNGHVDCFIQDNVKKVLDKCNIKTMEQGIGWRVVK